MADGRPLTGKIIEILENDSELETIIGRELFVEISQFSPVGNEYPQITIAQDEGVSESIFPAGHYNVYICIWVEEGTQGAYGVLERIKERVNALLNRKGDSLSEIDVGANEGLRVAWSIKTGGATEFEKDSKLFCKMITFSMVISEGESFDPDDAGNKEWV